MIGSYLSSIKLPKQWSLELVYITPTVLVVVDIHNRYSESGIEYQKYQELQVYHPQLSNISGLLD